MHNIPLHPATKILLWLMLAVAIQWLRMPSLLALSLLLGLLLAAARASGFGRLLRRTRWLLLSLLLIYAFATPGDPLLPSLGAASPTAQGLEAGGMQAWRLAMLLAGLSLLLAACSRNDLLAGLYLLLRPFSFLGLDAEKFAVRIWLTLHYAEQERAKGAGEWWLKLRSALAPAPGELESVTLEAGRLTWRDAAALLLAVALIILLSL
ncbi:MAG: hypothetical protein AB1710_03055 [Pseudomonadota bacterium]